MAQERVWNFKDWYKDNADDFNADRRTRYESDPEYRARVLETNRASRERQRQARLKEQAAQKKAAKVVVRKAPWKEVAAPSDGDGQQKTLYTIGYLATALGRSVQVIRLWEKQGVIPRTPLTNAKGDRMYTAEMIDAIHEILKDKGRLKESTRGKRRPLRATIKLSNGNVVDAPVFRVGKASAALGRSVVTLEQMERNGNLPETPFRTKADHRLYTAEMIEAMKAAFDSRLEGPSLHAAVESAWTKRGIVGAKLVKVVQVTEDDNGGDPEEAGR